MTDISGLLVRLHVWLATTLASPRRDQRGDVPGWVLITVMTAGLVVVIWGVAKDTLTDLLKTALNSVTG